MKPIYLDYNAATPIDPQVVDAIGANAVRARGAIRFSFGKFTTEDEIKIVLEMLKKVAQQSLKSL